jgi:hypothetical protein
MKNIPLICILLSAIILAIGMAIPLGVATGVLYVAVILLSLWEPRKGFTLQMAILCSILTIAGFFLAPPGGELWKVLCNRALALYAIWVTAFLTLQRKRLEEEREQAVRKREKALEDVKILRGFLPICASCKKIRDDKGYWNQIEAYIHDHSEADFSHGICPDCVRKLYPEYYTEEMSGSDTGEEGRHGPK